jgi:hypothetical protein
MNVDKIRPRPDNRFVPGAAPQRARSSAFVLSEVVAGLSFLVLDFDHFGPEESIKRLSAASQDCRLAVWFPWKYSPAEVAEISQRLVDIGATPFERSAPDKNLQECWNAAKADLLARIQESEGGLPAGN